MRIAINIIAIFAFIMQSISFVFGVLNLRRPECVIDSIYNHFIFISFLCSQVTVVIFIAIYNFDLKAHRIKLLNYIYLIIVMLGSYIHITQLIVFNDFILTSCILLFFDCYIFRKIHHNLRNHASNHWGDSGLNQG